MRVVITISRILPIVSAAAIAGCASLVLLGWLIESDRLTGVTPGLVRMNPLTAILFLFAAFSLALNALRVRGSGPRLCSLTCALLTMVLTGWILAVYAGAASFAPDRLLFQASLESNRMAPNTAIQFVLSSFALVALNFRGRQWRRLHQSASLLVLSGSVLTCIGYAFSASVLYVVGNEIPMALNTAVLFVLLAIGLLGRHPECGLARMLLTPASGGMMARRLVLPALILPVAIGYLRLEGQRAGYYGTEIGSALFTASSILLVLTAIAITASRLNRTDRERKRVALALTKAASSFRDLYNNAPCGYHSIDAETRVTQINDTELGWLGYERTEVEGCLSFFDLLSMDSRERFRQLFAGESVPQSVRDLELDMLRKDGTVLPVRLNAINTVDAAGRMITSRASLFDASELKRAEAAVCELNDQLEQKVIARTKELAEANRDLLQKTEENEMFVYSVSHDLRSPLVNLQGFSKELTLASEGLQSILERDTVPQQVRDDGLAILAQDLQPSVHFIGTAVMRLSSIIDALLRLSRAGRVEYQRRTVNMNELIARVVEVAGSALLDGTVDFRVSHLPPCHGDPTAVEQVFANLIGNALKYLDPHRPGRIEIGVCESQCSSATAGVTYFVRDNGLGISAAHHERIFQAFKRFHPQAAPGDGMGLAIVQRIVARHGGRVWVESEEGQGSTFFVLWPAPIGHSLAGDLVATGKDTFLCNSSR